MDPSQLYGLFCQAACTLMSAESAQERAKAEAVLLEFKAMPAPYDLCASLLKSGQPPVLFQALCTLKYALLREWTALSEAQVSQLREDLLSFAKQPSLPAFVLNEAVHVLAVMFKRGWTPQLGSLCEANLTQLFALGQPEPTQVAAKLCLALLQEFSSGKASSIGTPWEYHLQCHRAFEPLLKNMVVLVLKVCQAVIASVTQSRSPVQTRTLLKVLQACLGVLLEALQWEFVETMSDTALALRALEQSSSLSSASVAIKPGPTWTDLIVQSGLVGFMTGSYEGLLKVCRELKESNWGELGHTLRQAFIQLCSIQGSIFTGELKPQYLTSLVTGLQSLVSTMGLSGASVDQSAVLELAQAVQRLASTFGVAELPKPFFDELFKLTSWLLGPSVVATLTDLVDTWATEACDLLLEAWVGLLTECQMGGAALEPVRNLLAEHALAIFRLYVERRMWVSEREILGRGKKKKQNPAEDDEYESENEQFSDKTYVEDQLGAIGILARMRPLEALEILVRGIRERTALLQQWIQWKNSGVKGNPPCTPAIVHEQLHWLISLLGYTLADSVEGGDVPMIPDPLMALSKRSNSSADPVIHAVECVFSYVTLENQAIQSCKDDSLSPILAQTSVWFLERWSRTYLYFSESVHSFLSPNLLTAFSQTSPQAHKYLDFVVAKVVLNLVSWSEEHDLGASSLDLLHSLVKDRAKQAHLFASPSWSRLAEFYQMVLRSDTRTRRTVLHGPVLGRLVLSLAQAAGSSGEAGFFRVVEPITRRWEAVLPQLGSPSHLQPSFVAEVDSCLQMLRGIAKCSGGQCFRLAFAYLSNYFVAVTRLVLIYGSRQPQITLLILKLFRDVAEVELVHMEPGQIEVFMGAGLQLVQAYGEANKIRLKNLQGKGEDNFEDLECLLALLMHISSSELAVEQDGMGMEAVLLCLTMLPLSAESLQYPDVCENYFSLLRVAVSSVPDKFRALSSAVQTVLLESLTWAITTQLPATASAALQALACLFKIHLKAPISSLFDSLVSKFQLLLFNIILFQPVNSELLDNIADCLFPLILCQPGSYNENVLSFIGSQISKQDQKQTSQQLEEHKARLVRGFVTLTDVGVTIGTEAGTALTRATNARFRTNLRTFIQNVRSILQTK